MYDSNHDVFVNPLDYNLLDHANQLNYYHHQSYSPTPQDQSYALQNPCKVKVQCQEWDSDYPLKEYCYGGYGDNSSLEGLGQLCQDYPSFSAFYPAELDHYRISDSPESNDSLLKAEDLSPCFNNNNNFSSNNNINFCNSSPSPPVYFQDRFNVRTSRLSCSDEDSSSYDVPPPIKRPGRPRTSQQPKRKTEKRMGKLWEFLRNLLLDRETCPSLIKWDNYKEGTFKFVQSEKVAQLWGNRKKNDKMNYEKLSRAMRYYYRSEVLLPVSGKRLVYKFGPQATGWRTENPILS